MGTSSCAGVRAGVCFSQVFLAVCSRSQGVGPSSKQQLLSGSVHPGQGGEAGLAVAVSTCHFIVETLFQKAPPPPAHFSSVRIGQDWGSRSCPAARVGERADLVLNLLREALPTSARMEKWLLVGTLQRLSHYEIIYMDSDLTLASLTDVRF